jgi:hypothetical protein
MPAVFRVCDVQVAKLPTGPEPLSVAIVFDAIFQ